METSAYYALSTVAQAMAGAMGFLVAIVLFGLQGVDRQLRYFADDLVVGRINDTDQTDPPSLANKIYGALVAGRFSELLGLLDTPDATEHLARMTRERRHHLATFRSLVAHRRKIVRVLGFSLVATSLCVLYCEGLIGLVPLLQCARLPVVIGGAYLLSVVCVVAFLWLAWLASSSGGSNTVVKSRA